MPSDVFVGYLHPNELSASFHQSLFQLIQYDGATNQRLGRYGNIRTSGYSIPEGRNELVEGCLREGCDWLFMVDADMGFLPDSLDRLLESADPVERPIVGGLAFAYRDSGDDGYFGFRSYPLPTIFDWVEHPDGKARMTGRRHYPVNSMVQCAATGAAFVLIHRSVLEKIRDEGQGKWFDRIPGPDGLLGEDISFFYRVGAAGFPVWVNTGVRSTHHKNIWVSEPDFWNGLTVPPAISTVDVIVPTVKERFDHLRPLVETLKASTGLATCWLIVDSDLDAGRVGELEALGARVVRESGSFPHKINWWWDNTPHRAPWVQIVGDDCRFHPGWFDHAMFIADKYGAKVIATNDLANERVVRGEHATHPLISADYIRDQGASWDGPGVICHEGYAHNYVDDEITTAAKQRGVFQAALGSKIEHRHPIVGSRPADQIDTRNQSTFLTDQKLFLRRLRDNT